MGEFTSTLESLEIIMKKFWKNKNVLVTGATGLVGSWLTRALIQREANVIVLVRDLEPQSELIRSGLINRTSIVQGSLEDGISVERAISEFEIDTVFHLGAQTLVGTALRNPVLTFESNIRGTYMLLDACRKHKQHIQRILIASSDKAYGSSDVLPYTEEMPLHGIHPYDVSKSCTDLLAMTYYHTYQLPIAVARCGNIFGGGDLNWSRLIPGTIRNLLNDVDPEIRSDGSFTRDYIFVDDVVEAYLLLARELHREDVRGEAFNFGPNRPYSVMEIASKLQVLMNKESLEFKILNKAVAEIRDQTLDSSKARSILSWEPQHSLETGLEETIKWYTNYLNQTNKQTMSALYEPSLL